MSARFHPRQSAASEPADGTLRVLKASHGRWKPSSLGVPPCPHGVGKVWINGKSNCIFRTKTAKTDSIHYSMDMRGTMTRVIAKHRHRLSR